MAQPARQREKAGKLYPPAIQRLVSLQICTSLKTGFLAEISRFARELELTVGFGDNEFLPYSDGRSCCNGADLYLRELNLFQSNSASLVGRKRAGELIRFDALTNEWVPKSRINTYLNSRVRTKSRGIHESEWHSYLRQHWKIGAIYSPDFFHGVRFAGIHDNHGRPMFIRSQERL
jgi:hypothetical protein